MAQPVTRVHSDLVRHGLPACNAGSARECFRVTVNPTESLHHRPGESCPSDLELQRIRIARAEWALTGMKEKC